MDAINKALNSGIMQYKQRMYRPCTIHILMTLHPPKTDLILSTRKIIWITFFLVSYIKLLPQISKGHTIFFLIINIYQKEKKLYILPPS